MTMCTARWDRSDYRDHVCDLPAGHQGPHKCFAVGCPVRWLGENRRGLLPSSDFLPSKNVRGRYARLEAKMGVVA